MIKILSSIFAHGLSAVLAFVSLGALHSFTNREIWAFFTWSHQVRQLSIYLLDAFPFFLLSLLAVLALSAFIFHLRSFKLSAFYGAVIAAAVLAVFLHRPFFPSDSRAAAFLLVYAFFYASFYALIYAAMTFRLSNPRRTPWSPWPVVERPLGGLAAGLFGAFIYAGGLLGAVYFGYPAEEETFSEKKYTITKAPDFFSAQAAPFAIEELPFRGSIIRLADMDNDGLIDVLLKNPANRIELWLNKAGTFTKKKDFLAGVDNSSVHDFYVADYDRDGKFDILVSKYAPGRASGFVNTVLKKVYWYPFNDVSNLGRLYRQKSLGSWEDVTERAFPDGAPEAFRKVEPILWFDANGDGRLDFVWSQYPNPRHSLNKLYVQNADGTFKDRFKDLIKGTSAGVYAEGSDVADYNGDGKIDLFAYGFLYRNEGGKYVQVCGDDFPGIYCDARGRNDEGATFEDMNADGFMDLALSYNGPNGILPKYYFQLFLGDEKIPGKFRHVKKVARQYYGYHVFMRAKDFDFDGAPDILTSGPGRLLSFRQGPRQGRLDDMFPAVTGEPTGNYKPAAWLDVEGDGDWDFIAFRGPDSKAVLFRNRLNPKRYVRISVAGPGGIENQYGATLTIRTPDGKKLLRSYRPTGGYAGIADPAIIVPLKSASPLNVKVCFPSISGKPAGEITAPGVRVGVLSVKKKCAEYKIEIDGTRSATDLQFIAGAEVARIN